MADHPLALMRLHVAALFTQDARDRLVSVNQPAGGPAPRFFLGRTADGAVWFVRNDVDADLAGALETMVQGGPPTLPTGPEPERDAPFLDLLSRPGLTQRVWAGPAYHFPVELPVSAGVVEVTADNRAVLERYLPDWLPDVAPGVPMTASLEGGHAVSVCCSVRVTDRAHEAGVETHRDFRKRGLAAPVLAAWARAVRRLGPIPLYSTSWQNPASIAVARRLGLIHYGTTLHVT